MDLNDLKKVLICDGCNILFMPVFEKNECLYEEPLEPVSYICSICTKQKINSTYEKMGRKESY